MSKTKLHPLYGRRILHVLSPVRWSGQKFKSQSDSNFKVAERIIKWLPMCHHYLLVPPHHDVEYMGDNVTIIPFPYPGSVLYNRAFFDSKAFLKWYDASSMDIDFVFLHQPELLYNIEGTLHVARVAPTLKKFVFFHWVDCPLSKPIEDYPEGFWRLIEAISLADKSYFHGPQSLKYLESNFDASTVVKGLNNDALNQKVSWMPLPIAPIPEESSPIPLPKKKILVFNHRWNNTTGISKLISYTEGLNRDEYLVWVTDKDAANPKAGEAAPKWMKVQNLNSRAEYRYLLEHAHATLTFVDGYATWNMSVQDGITVGTPGLVFYHPVMPEILGEDYPYYFRNKKGFVELLDAVKRPFKWTIPNHGDAFKKALFEDMIANLHVMKQEPKGSREWVNHILNLGDSGYKKHLLYNTHPNLFASNSWERIRCWCMNHGAVDDPHSRYTRLSFPNEEEARKLIDGMTFEPTKKNPNFTVKAVKFW